MRMDHTAFKDAHAVVVGGGVAGLTTALKLAPHPVILLMNTPLGEGAATLWAQGGIAAAIGKDDSPRQHGEDTILASAGIADPDIVALATRDALPRIQELIALGAEFDRTPMGELAVGREAAHSVNRILHIHGDGTGAGLMRVLIEAVRNCPSITLAENFAAEELLVSRGRVCGLSIRRTDAPDAPPLVLTAGAVVLATGGIGALYALTTNPPQCAGEGLAMAASAGARLADLEFVQFHPTAMDIGRNPAPLATEALRGEGAVLVNEMRERFMLPVHAAGELAPRDIAARAIWRQLRDGHKVYLDCRAAIGKAFPARFPTVYALAMAAGIDPSRDLIPVAPAEHYHMGGIATDCNGRSSLPGLWACGEVAATGLHGANRLASNSLLEGMVFGARAAADIAGLYQKGGFPSLPAAAEFTPRWRSHDGPESAAWLVQLRDIMSRHAGVVRSEAGLREALAELEELDRKTGNRYARIGNMIHAASLICAAALQRRESRGGHFREDYPEENPALRKRSFFSPEREAADFPMARSFA